MIIFYLVILVFLTNGHSRVFFADVISFLNKLTRTFLEFHRSFSEFRRVSEVFFGVSRSFAGTSWSFPAFLGVSWRLFGASSEFFGVSRSLYKVSLEFPGISPKFLPHVQWHFSSRFKWSLYRTVNYTGGSGEYRVPFLKWVEENDWKTNQKALKTSAESLNRSLKVLKEKNECPVNDIKNFLNVYQLYTDEFTRIYIEYLYIEPKWKHAAFRQI